jgi:hypothetical protein
MEDHWGRILEALLNSPHDVDANVLAGQYR